MAFDEEINFEGRQGIIDRASDFLDNNIWFIFLFFFASLALFLFAVLYPSPSAQQQPVGAVFDFNYGPVLVYKNVFEEDNRHLEKIIVSSQGGARMLSLFVLVPKALAQSSADVVASSNGRISVLKADPLYRIDALNNDSISLELSVSGSDNLSCSLLVVMHSAVVAGMTQEQLQGVVDAIAAKDVPGLDCEKANAIEQDLAERIYAAATQEEAPV